MAQRVLHGGEINRVFENARAFALRPRDVRTTRDEEFAFDALVRVADVFRREREQHLAHTPAFEATCEQIKEIEKGALPAIRDREILRPDVPAKCALQQRCERGEEARISLRRIVVAEHPIQRGAVGDDCAHPLAQERLHLRHRRGIATAEHAHIRLDGHGAAEIVHEL